MKKRVLSIALVVAMIAIIAAGSFAYFTDKDEATNTFTVGNVKIDLLESSLHRENAGYANGTTPDKVKPQNFELWSEQDKKGVPASEYKYGEDCYSDEQIIEDARDYQSNLAADNKLAPGEYYHKMPYVRNTGANDAYVRIRVMFPAALDTAILNSSMYTASCIDSGEFTMSYDNSGTVEVDGVKYNVYTFTRVNTLAPNEMTYWNVWGTVHMDSDVTNEEITALLGDKGTFNVLVQADAIQAEGFDNATEAFAAFDAQK